MRPSDLRHILGERFRNVWTFHATSDICGYAKLYIDGYACMCIATLMANNDSDFAYSLFGLLHNLRLLPQNENTHEQEQMTSSIFM